MGEKSKLEKLPNKVLYALCKKIYTRCINKYGRINNPFFFNSTGDSTDDYITVLNLADATKLIDIDFVYNCIKLNEDNFKKNDKEFNLTLPKFTVYNQYYDFTETEMKKMTYKHKIDSYSNNEGDVTNKFNYEYMEDYIDNWVTQELVD